MFGLVPVTLVALHILSATQPSRSVRLTQTRVCTLQRQLDWKHNLVLWVVSDEVKASLPEPVKSWIVNTTLGLLMYLILGGVWAFFIYRVFRNTR